MTFSDRLSDDHFAHETTIHEHPDKLERIPHQIKSVKKHEQETIIGHFNGKLFQEMEKYS